MEEFRRGKKIKEKDISVSFAEYQHGLFFLPGWVDKTIC